MRDLINNEVIFMVVKEFFKTREDGVNLFRNYSDKNFYIKQDQTGIEYTEAIDVENAPYTYTETDIPIDGDPIPIDEEIVQKAEAYDYLTGRGDSDE
jgi:hypothetical protein